MWQAEVLQRQGSWVRRFRTKKEAKQWCSDRVMADANSENPVLSLKVEKVEWRKQLPPPQPPEKPFDESWKS